MNDTEHKNLTLFKCAQYGGFPPGTTNKDLLAAIRDGKIAQFDEAEEAKNGRNLHSGIAHRESAFLRAAFYGNLLPGTTIQDLKDAQLYFLGHTGLYCAALGGKLPPETTVDDLIQSKSPQGWSALHGAAASGILLPGTTMHDLINTVGPDQTTAFDHLPNNWESARVKTLLDATNAISLVEAKTFGAMLIKRYSGKHDTAIVVSTWMVREMKRLSA